MTERRYWRLSAVIGLAAMIVSRLFGTFAGLKTCIAPPGIEPIIAFELARAPGDVFDLLASAACRQAQLSALWLDGLAFIPTYSLFLAFAALAVFGRRGGWVVALVAVAALADEVEGLALGALLKGYPDAIAPFAVLIPAVRIKFGLLALATAAIGGGLVRRRGWWMLPGAAIVAGAALALVSVMDDVRAATVMMLGFALAWVALLVTAAILALRPARR